MGSNKVYREVHRILPDPEEKGLFWLGTDAGLYKYESTGDMWTHMNQGLASKRDIDVVHFIDLISEFIGGKRRFRGAFLGMASW